MTEQVDIAVVASTLSLHVASKRSEDRATKKPAVPKYGGVLVGPDQLRQVFNDTNAEVLWLIIDAPEELEFLQGSKSQMDLSLIYPTDPTQLPKELADVQWPPKS
jgi:hypothetical protein